MEKMHKKSITSKLLLMLAICTTTIITIYSCKKETNTSTSSGIQCLSSCSRIKCKPWDQTNCCGASSFACTGTGNPVTLEEDQMSGLSVATLQGNDTVIVTNTFDKSNITEATFKTMSYTGYRILQDTSMIDQKLLKDVFSASKITGFPTSVFILPGEHLFNVTGSVTNNNVIITQKYFIAKNGTARMEYWVKSK